MFWFEFLKLLPVQRIRKTCALIGLFCYPPPPASSIVKVTTISACTQQSLIKCICQTVWFNHHTHVHIHSTHWGKSDSEAVIHRNGTIKYSNDWSHSTDGFNYGLTSAFNQAIGPGIRINLEDGVGFGLRLW